MADGAAHRVGGAQDVVAPQQRPRGEPLQARPRGRRRARRAARRRSPRGPRRRSARAGRRRAPAAWRRPARRARGPPTPGTASRLASATTSDGAGRATSGRAASRALSCSSLRVRSQAASVAGGSVGIRSTLRRRRKQRSCQHGGVPPAAEDPADPDGPGRATRPAAIRWLAGGVIAVVLGVLLGVAVVAVGREAAGGSRRRAWSSSCWSWSATVAAVAGTGALLRAAPLAPRPGRDAVAGRAAAHRRSRGPRLRARRATTSSTPTTSRCGCGCSAPRSGGRGRCSGWTAPRCAPRRVGGGEWVLTADGLDTVVGAREVRPGGRARPRRGSSACGRGAAREDEPRRAPQRRTWTRRRHGQAQGEERAPGGAHLGRVRRRRPAADRAHQRRPPARSRPSARTTASRCRSTGSATPTRPTSPTGPACRWWRDASDEHARAAVLQQRDLDGPPAGRHDRGEPGSDGGAGGRPRGAGRVRHRPPLVQLSAVRRRGRRRAPSGWTPSASRKGDRVGIWAPNCAEWAFVQYGTAKLGAILVNINPAYRTHELAYVLKQAGISVLVSAPEFKTSDYRAMVAEVRGDCPDLREVLFLGDPEWERLLDTGRAGDRELLVAAGDRAVGRRPDQHPVHVGHDRLPEGRHAHPPQPAQQRVLRGRGLRLHRGRPDLHPGALLPLLRHGHGQPRRPPRTARRWSSRRPGSTRR